MASSEQATRTRRGRGDSSWGNFDDSKACAETQQREEQYSRQQKTERLRALRQARDSVPEGKN